jgi:hypothetical protein
MDSNVDQSGPAEESLCDYQDAMLDSSVARNVSAAVLCHGY